jgi:hypothetical protein
LIDDDDSSLISKLENFARKIKKEIIMVIDYFLSFLTRYDERRAHNMLALMLDSILKV